LGFVFCDRTDDCVFVAPDGSTYDLSPLKRYPGEEPYSFSSKPNNAPEWEFNVCGHLDGLGKSYYPKEAAVVYYETPSTIRNAGERASFASLSNGRRGVEVVLGEGEACENTQRKTTFEFICEEATDAASMTPLVVEGVRKVDTCYNVITVRSKFACPLVGMNQFSVEEDVDVSGGMTLMILFFTLAACCICVCACCSRRRRCARMKRMNKENEMIQFSNVAFQQVPLEEFVEPPRPQPQAPQMPQQMMPMQYLQAPQYFLYPSVQTPVQQSPASLEENMISDEELARRLQAQFDQEAHV